MRATIQVIATRTISFVAYGSDPKTASHGSYPLRSLPPQPQDAHCCPTHPVAPAARTKVEVAYRDHLDDLV